MRLSVVASSVVVADATHVLAEMTDGSLVELSMPWGVPQPIVGRWSTRDPLQDWRWKTEAQLRELAQDHNCARKAEVSYNVHASKVRTLGAGYAARGYR